MAETRLKDIQQQIQGEAAKRDVLEQRLNDRIGRIEEQQMTHSIITQLDATVRVLIDKVSSVTLGSWNS